MYNQAHIQNRDFRKAFKKDTNQKTVQKPLTYDCALRHHMKARIRILAQSDEDLENLVQLAHR